MQEVRSGHIDLMGMHDGSGGDRAQYRKLGSAYGYG